MANLAAPTSAARPRPEAQLEGLTKQKENGIFTENSLERKWVRGLFKQQ